jgi:ATP-binding cassette, subfamily B, bacterial MsbA
MNPFYRALQEALRYWHLLALSIACSVGVAAMWVTNIAALYPVMNVTLSGKSLQAWNHDNALEADKKIKSISAEQQALMAEIGTAEPTLDQQKMQQVQQANLDQAKAELRGYEKLQPWLDAYLPETPMKTVWAIIGLVFIGNLVKQMLIVLNQCLVGYVSICITRDIQVKLFNKALELDRPTYLAIGTSTFAAQITNTANSLGQGIMCFYGRAITEPLKIVFSLAGALYFSWRLTIACLVVAPVITFLILWLNRKLKKIAHRALDRTLGFHHIIVESLNNLLTVQAYTMEDHERKRFKASSEVMLNNSMRYTFYDALTSPITEALGVGMICIAICMGSFLIINGATHIMGVRMASQPLTVESLTIFFGMLVSINDPVRKLSSVVSILNSGSIAAKSLYHMLDLPSSIKTPEKPQTVARPFKQLEFRDVSFAYHANEPVLKDVNLTIPFGQKVAIVGPNGGGKSTLMNLVNRFYDPWTGAVYLDDVPLHQMALSDLRGRIALVTQQIEMFNDTILMNIRYGRWDATDEECIAAAKKAFAHDFICSFTEGYQTIVGQSGQRLSGGQRQRIALARAILRDAEILILDEATSQIDAASEELIHNALQEVARNRTVLMITHRASTLELADVIVHVKHGKVTVEPNNMHKEKLRLAA